jgi:hypothetical protein
VVTEGGTAGRRGPARLPGGVPVKCAAAREGCTTLASFQEGAAALGGGGWLQLPFGVSATPRPGVAYMRSLDACLRARAARHWNRQARRAPAFGWAALARMRWLVCMRTPLRRLL